MSSIDASAESYMAAFDDAQWQVQRSPLVCKLVHNVPRFGQAIFETVGGGRQSFVLQTKRTLLVGGPSHLTAQAPSWNSARKPVDLGPIDIADGAQPLRLEAEPAKQLLDALQAGLVPTLARPSQVNAGSAASVALSPINFLAAYRDYAACKTRLLPVTFDDVKNTVVEFAQDESELSAAARKQIDSIVRYSELDHTVKRIVLSGVSNDKKRLLDNFDLAKSRMQAVSDYLVNRGIDTQAIRADYRGERASNNRAKRVVSIRLERSGNDSPDTH